MSFYDLLQWPTGGMLQPTHIDNCGITRQFIFMSNFQSNPQPSSHAYSATVCRRRKAQPEAKDYTDLLIFGKKDPNSRKQIEQWGWGMVDEEWTWQQSELCKDVIQSSVNSVESFPLISEQRHSILYLFSFFLHLNGKNSLSCS